MNINILDFLMEHDVILKAVGRERRMTADAMYELGGEFVVYTPQQGYSLAKDLYRGNDFDTALMWLEGREDEIDG